MKTTTNHSFKKGLWAAGALLLAVAGQRALSSAKSSRRLKDPKSLLEVDASWAGKARDKLRSAFDTAEATSEKLATKAGRLADKAADSAESMGNVAMAKIQQASSSVKNALSRAEHGVDELSTQTHSNLRHVIDESADAASRLEETVGLRSVSQRAEKSTRSLAARLEPAAEKAKKTLASKASSGLDSASRLADKASSAASKLGRAANKAASEVRQKAE